MLCEHWHGNGFWMDLRYVSEVYQSSQYYCRIDVGTRQHSPPSDGIQPILDVGTRHHSPPSVGMPPIHDTGKRHHSPPSDGIQPILDVGARHHIPPSVGIQPILPNYTHFRNEVSILIEKCVFVS